MMKMAGHTGWGRDVNWSVNVPHKNCIDTHADVCVSN